MPTPQIDDEMCLEALRIRGEHKSASDAAIAMGIPRTTLASRLARAAQRGLDGSLPKALPPGQVLRAASTLYAKDEAGGWTEKLQWVKSASDGIDLGLDVIKAAFDEYQGRAELTEPPKQWDGALMSVYPCADLHLGLMSWGRETGEAYDLKIGADRFRSCMMRLIRQSPNSETALILNLGDFFHADDNRNQTPASGAKLDVDGRYFKVLTVGVQLMMDVIDGALQKHQRVTVRNLPGNHDPHISFALTVALSAFYSKEPRVTISDDPSEFFYYRFGNSLIGANHGHRMKPQDMAMHMAVTRKEDWAASKFRHYYAGHIHHVTAKEVAGVIVESFQTLAAKDAWHSASGYLSGQSIQSITFDYTDGEIGRHRINIGQPQ